MKIEDLVEAFNLSIRQDRQIHNISNKSHIVLLKVIEQNNSFKAYKTYKYILWYINGKSKYKLFTSSITGRVLDGQEEKIIKDIELKFSFSLLEFIRTDYYNLVIEGKYYGGADTN